jgi:hypothetical protein
MYLSQYNVTFVKKRLSQNYRTYRREILRLRYDLLASRNDIRGVAFFVYIIPYNSKFVFYLK